MDLFSESSLVRDDNGLVTCQWCSAHVHGSPWKHLAWFCSYFATYDDPAIQKTAELAMLAHTQVDEFPTLWLRGIPNLDPPPCPLSVQYLARMAGSDRIFTPDEPSEAPFDVQGLLLGGDGSGGEYSKDDRVRRGGFGLVAIDSLTLEVKRMWYGSVPGAQSGYTAECAALLHALLRTSGNCTMVMDNMPVIKLFRKSPRSDLKHNGLLWQAIFQARDQRRLRGGGDICLTWIGSHKTLEHSLQAGACPEHWVVNSIADALAGRAASEAGLPADRVEQVLSSATKAHSILARLVCVATHIKPAAGREGSHCRKNSGEKLQQVEKWAKAAGHALTSSCRCVKCGLQINLAHSALSLEGILTMPCVGGIRQDLLKHEGRSGEDCILLLNNIEAHSSHALATSGALRLHFCVSCGCYGASRSNKLRQPCRHFATEAGRAALASIAAGKRHKL